MLSFSVFSYLLPFRSLSLFQVFLLSFSVYLSRFFSPAHTHTHITSWVWSIEPYLSRGPHNPLLSSGGDNCVTVIVSASSLELSLWCRCGSWHDCSGMATRGHSFEWEPRGKRRNFRYIFSWDEIFRKLATNLCVYPSRIEDSFFIYSKKYQIAEISIGNTFEETGISFCKIKTYDSLIINFKSRWHWFRNEREKKIPSFFK